MKTNQNQSSQKQAIIKAIKAIKAICSLAEEQHYYQQNLFGEISEITAIEYTPLVPANRVLFAKTRLKTIDEAVDYVVETAEARHNRRFEMTGKLSEVGENNAGYYVDRLYDEFRKLEELINSDE